MVKQLIFSIFSLLAFPGVLRSQNISGSVTCDGTALSNVVCRALTEKDSLLCYTITDHKGCFVITTDQLPAKIRFQLLGYETAEVNTSLDRTVYNIALSKTAIALKEVFVKANPITSHGDTLNYNVGLFRHKEDEHIEDVIRRLPGIEVSDAGIITYMGKSINKLNIEGQDLMGNAYNQATQNMPVDAVAMIQVMENNQPVRALEGKVNNDHATLNIKLKSDYRMRPFGEIESGVGMSPLLWGSSATAIQTNKKNQTLLTGSMDNHGISLSSLMNEMANHGNIYNEEPLPDNILTTSATRRLPISPLYYLMNKSYYVGLNHLHALGEYSSIRFNLLYNHEGETAKDSTFTAYKGADPFCWDELKHINLLTNRLRAQIRYELNAKNIYLEDILTASVRCSSGGRIFLLPHL